MAIKPSFLEEELLCSVCCDTFNDPVVLQCSHSFCDDCLQRCWKEKRSRECPVCRRKSSVPKPPVNLALKNIVELYLKQKTQSEAEVFCRLHGEKLLLFCEDDDEPLCVVCQTSKKHRNHQLCPVEEAALDLKKNLKTALDPMKQKLQIFTEVKQQFENIAEHIRTQGPDTEMQIKAEFAKLHRFLQDEEAISLSALKKEVDQKSQAMKEKIESITKLASALSEKITAIQKVIESEDILIIKRYKDANRRAQCTLEDPELPSWGSLVDVAKHLSNLKFRVWEKMLDMVQYTPVTLDPNTAAPWLCLSEDLTSVRNTGFVLQRPDNPERFNPCVDVLGAEGFASGKHSWEVEVGDKPEWTIGVVRESINRKGAITCDPASGIFVVTLRAGDVYGAEGVTPLTLKKKPERVKVQLDFDTGEVSFFDSSDMSLIHTFYDLLPERLFPYFSPCVNINGSNCGAMQICPVKVSVTISQSQ
ncbi:E3 ubiquitin-protein ligase TRIM35-like [Anguilla rostrata]|uniref:E3 ubiquitin-protein ligase TRIM35-like n=1 Tax=Anguilla rostrata TaxID=7938 RepID=UPI0030CD9C63